MGYMIHMTHMRQNRKTIPGFLLYNKTNLWPQRFAKNNQIQRTRKYIWSDIM